nr:hypothetical protein [Tanacetum cinerariifolium]GEZ56107.1 hypothetical protein [Tanacetum cinerariifolium]
MGCWGKGFGRVLVRRRCIVTVVGDEGYRGKKSRKIECGFVRVWDFHRSILTDLQVTPTKPGRMTKPYSSYRFIANCFNAENLKMKVKTLHSFLRVLSYDESKSKKVFEHVFMTLFGQDNETFTSTMFLYVAQLQNQLDKDEFQEDKSMAAFWVLSNQFQKSIDWQYFLDYDSEMTKMLFAEYSGIKVKSLEKHYSYTWVVSSKALDASLVVIECTGTKSNDHITSSSSGNYITHVVDADIKPINDHVPSVEVKENQENDKIGSKLDKNRKRGEDRKSQKQLQSREKEKLKKIQVEGPKMQSLTKLFKKEERKGLDLQLP